MKKLLKVLGAAALIAGFAPYQFEGDKEKNTVTVRALLWSVTRGPGKEDGKDELFFDFGLQPPFRKEEEAELFSDELTVDYGGGEEKAVPVTPEDEAPVEGETPVEPEKPVEPETPAETPVEPVAPAEDETPVEPED